MGCRALWAAAAHGRTPSETNPGGRRTACRKISGWLRSLNEGRIVIKNAQFLTAINIRKMATVVEDRWPNESGQLADGAMLRKMVLAAVVQNPYAGRFSRSLDRSSQGMQTSSAQEFGRRLTELTSGRKIVS